VKYQLSRFVIGPALHLLARTEISGAENVPAAGGAIRIEQRDFSPDRLAAEIGRLAGDPSLLARMAQAAKAAGTIDAADRLADLVMTVAAV